uniref:Hepatic triacyl glycerol lipase n=1 Tax=Tetracapsuloides bryosalmonae TaxID=271932 RepID=A0A859IR65_9CNID|nr:hepatic triacyl glycerol lipase [Tetracapsuloides bryosalmonae]
MSTYCGIIFFIISITIINCESSGNLLLSTNLIQNVFDYTESIKNSILMSITNYFDSKLIYIKDFIAFILSGPKRSFSRLNSKISDPHLTAAKKNAFGKIKNSIKNAKMSKISKPHEWTDDLRHEFDNINSFYKLSKYHIFFDNLKKKIYKLIEMIPSDEENYKINIYIYNKNNRYNPIFIDPYNPVSVKFELAFVYIVFHDYLEKFRKSIYLKKLKNALLDRYPNCFVLLVDWSDVGYNPIYYRVALKSFIVAKKVTRYLQLLCYDFSITGSRMYYLGVGMGAHIAAYVQRGLSNSVHCYPYYSLALNPPLDYFLEKGETLGPMLSTVSVAVFTDINNEWFPKKIPIFSFAKEHYYVNNHFIQPNCPNLGGKLLYDIARCSHYRSVELFTETVEDENRNMYGIRCSSYSDFVNGLCYRCVLVNCGLFGIRKLMSQWGSFYTVTSETPPYDAYPVLVNIKFSNGFMLPFMQIFTTLQFEDSTVEIKTLSEYFIGPNDYNQLGPASGFFKNIKSVSFRTKYPGYIAVIIERFSIIFQVSIFSFTKCVQHLWFGHEKTFQFSKYHTSRYISY